MTFGKMLLRPILVVWFVSQALGDPMSEILSARAVPGSRVAVCVRGAGRCEGVVWRRRVLARDSCVGAAPLHAITVLPDSDGACAAGQLAERNGEVVRKVIKRFTHPAYLESSEEYDVCLLEVENSYEAKDSAVLPQTLSLRFDWWMDQVLHYSAEPNEYRDNTIRHFRNNKLFSSDLQMFLTTVVLPFSSFVVFFYFVTYYKSGSTKDDGYSNLEEYEENNEGTV